MYAIVEINGQQFKAEAGKKLFVYHIQDAEAQQTVEFERVLLVDNDGAITVGAPEIKGAKVVADVIEQKRDDKILVFKKKRRQNYRRTAGHRQFITVLKIKSIKA